MSAAREAHGISERRACTILGADWASVRYSARCGDDGPLRARLRALAAERRRFGCRRLGLLLKREGLAPNHRSCAASTPRSGYRYEGVAAASEHLARADRSQCRMARTSAGRWTSDLTR